MSRPLPARGRRESSIELSVTPLAPGDGRQRWVYHQLRDQILGGALPVHSRVPSTRSLAERLRVARSTVDWAYEQLRAEGYLVSVPGSGTYVCAQIPDRFLEAADVPQPAGASAPQGKSLADAPRAVVDEPDRLNAAFVARVADPTLFPLQAWRRHLVQALRRATPHQLADDDSRGSALLRTQIARYLGVARGIACAPEQVIVVSGIRQALDLSAQVLVEPGDKVLIEDPGYAHAREIFGRYAGKLDAVPIDGDGFSVARARRHRGVRLVHVTPAHQSPTGLTMPVSRRLELLEWAEDHQAWIVEDDYDSEFNYGAAPLPALKSLDAADRVIHCGSFNKTMFAALRIGYAVLPRALAERFARTHRVSGRSVGVVEQLALVDFLESGGFARHVRRSRAVYAQRRERVLATLRESLPAPSLRVGGEQGGFHFVWWLPAGLDEAGFIAAAAGHGLRFQGLAQFCERKDLPPAVLVGDSALDDAVLARSLAALRRLIDECLARCPS